MSGGVYKCHVLNSCRSHLGTHRCRNSFRNDARSIVLVVEGAGGGGDYSKKYCQLAAKEKGKKMGIVGRGNSILIYLFMFKFNKKVSYVKKVFGGRGQPFLLPLRTYVRYLSIQVTLLIG